MCCTWVSLLWRLSTCTADELFDEVQNGHHVLPSLAWVIESLLAPFNTNNYISCESSLHIIYPRAPGGGLADSLSFSPLCLCFNLFSTNNAPTTCVHKKILRLELIDRHRLVGAACTYGGFLLYLWSGGHFSLPPPPLRYRKRIEGQCSKRTIFFFSLTGRAFFLCRGGGRI